MPPDFISPLLDLRSSAPLLLSTVRPHPSFIFSGSCPYWFVRLRVFLELVDEIIKILLLLLPILEGSFL